jgi:hypothetical protein
MRITNKNKFFARNGLFSTGGYGFENDKKNKIV